MLSPKCADGIRSVHKIHIGSRTQHDDMQHGAEREMVFYMSQFTYHNTGRVGKTGTQIPSLYP